MQSKVKHQGQIYTPVYLVKDMLDFCGYYGYDIIGRHIMENSCGDGAFLREIVRRYCSCSHFNRLTLKSGLETYIHGIEKDPIEYKKCIANLNTIAAEFDLFDVKWDVRCGDALELSKDYYGKMDFIVGNPPYVRVHNLVDYDLTKQFSFTADGMTDLYLAFFEIGIKLLSPNGKICLITPSSWLRSNAGANFRKHIAQTKSLNKIADLEHFQPFNATTYTAITVLDNMGNSRKQFDYYKYNGAGQIEFANHLSYRDAFINGEIYLANNELLTEIRDIYVHGTGTVSVKNGFATLCDDVFIGDFDFARMCIPAIKSSTGKWTKCIYPYKSNGDPLPEFAVMDYAPLYKYLESHREALENRSIANKRDWYLFGRTQALRDVSRDKIAINQLVRDKDSLKINIVPAGSGVYGGLYIISDFSVYDVKRVLETDDFINYVKTLKNYKSGGYYTFSSKDLEKYLNYKLNKGKENEFRFVANA